MRATLLLLWCATSIAIASKTDHGDNPRALLYASNAFAEQRDIPTACHSLERSVASTSAYVEQWDHNVPKVARLNLYTLRQIGCKRW